ncbi:polymorphic toxin type 43 domain-containing protein [Chryseobacterium defluvii]|nr:polymorphic toxin type 43 domain-containing protein [Chryseobacterium defluvii]
MIGERIGGPGDPPDRSFVRRVWDWIWGIDRGHKSDKRLKGNYTIVTGIPIGTFERDEQTSWEAGDTRYEKVTVNTLITRKIGANNESPKYRFILPQNFGGWSQDNTGSDGLIWKGCLSCHADNGAFTYAVHNSQEANAGRMLSAVLQTAVGASFGTGSGSALKGSGPAAGVLEVSNNVESVAQFKNYFPKEGMIEFIFDTESNTFLVGKLKSGWIPGMSQHEKLVYSIRDRGVSQNKIVGGMFKREGNTIITDEFSGHYGNNWNNQNRLQFIKFMEKKTGLKVEHENWRN